MPSPPRKRASLCTANAPISRSLPGQHGAEGFPPVSPHTNDAACRRACEELLYINPRQLPKTPSGRVQLDWAAPSQQNFQAMLVTCLMSSARTPHPVEHPEKRCLPGIQGYLNTVISREHALEIYTNTACRIASRLMPVLYGGTRVAGVPGLRFLSRNRRRVRLVHLPTGARLDLIESHVSHWYRERDMRRTFHAETRWHDNAGIERLWDREEVTGEELAHAGLWARRACTPLRSAIMTRTMALWYKAGIYPTWMPPRTSSAHPVLAWARDDGDPNAEEIGLLLSSSAVAIPGAAFQADNANQGLLTLNGGSIQLSSAPFPGIG